jgi:hypothetical protein
MNSGRRCCLCWHYDSDFRQKHGQIAHLDQDPSNAAEDNLVFLCMPHHSEYDSTTRQHKNYTEQEVRELRERLYQVYKGLEGSLSGKAHWQFSIEGSVHACNKARLDSIVSALRYLLNDSTIHIEKIEEGSVVIHCEGRLESFLKMSAIIDADEFRNRIGKPLSTPQLALESLVALTKTLYSTFQEAIGSPSKAAIAVETFLTENALLRPLSATISDFGLEAIVGRLRTVFTKEYGEGAWQSARSFPLHLRAILMMAAMHWSAGSAQEALGGSDRRQPVVYLALGASAWGDAQEQKAMTAG